MMLEVKELSIEGYEKVIEATDKKTGLHSIIAVHNTRLGPSVGGCRIYPYPNTEEALRDALRLSKGMTYKSAMAEIGFGGGKSVIIADPKTDKTPELLNSFAQAVDSLSGKYICAEDVGSTVEDMVIINKTTPYVAALPSTESSGDPSPFTAWGCFRGMQAVAKFLWNSPSLENKTVTIQGLGAVGMKLAEFLFWHGAHLVVTDIDPEKVQWAAHHYGAKPITPDEFCSTECDILAPCALGASINDTTIKQLRCRAIAGSANNQLEYQELGEQLAREGILYAPDFVINSGGIINAAMEFEPRGYNPRKARTKVHNIYTTVLAIFEVAEERGISTTLTADELAESKLTCDIGKRAEALKLQTH